MTIQEAAAWEQAKALGRKWSFSDDGFESHVDLSDIHNELKRKRSICGSCGEAIDECRCQCSRGISSLSGSVKIGWWIDRDPGALFDASDLITRLPDVLDRVENAIVGAISQCVDVYIDGEDNHPIRVMFDLGGHEIEIDDGPVNGVLDEIRAEIGE